MDSLINDWFEGIVCYHSDENTWAIIREKNEMKAVADKITLKYQN